MKYYIKKHSTTMKLLVALIFIFVTTSTALAGKLGNGSLVYSCATYDGYFCCQAFVYTSYGWVEASNPSWYSVAMFN